MMNHETQDIENYNYHGMCSQCNQCESSNYLSILYL
jgi:hypothetical protein